MLGKSSEVIDDALLSDWPAVVAKRAVGEIGEVALDVLRW
jgi:hypothetical protein